MMNKIITLLGIAITLICCKDPYKDELFRVNDEQTIGVWLESQPEYSDWVTLLKRADLFNAVCLGNNSLTCFVADNKAVSDYLNTHTDYTSIAEMSDEDVDYLMRYHIIAGVRIAYNNIFLKLSVPTASGDFLTAGMDDGVRFINNGEDRAKSYIVTGDIAVSNGVVHKLGSMLLPFTETIWTAISKDSKYSILAQALTECGLDEFLAATYREIGGTTIRDNKTLFAVTDDVFRAHGIESVADIKSRYDGDPTDPNSMFYQFMAYHIMNKMCGYSELSDFPRIDGITYNNMILYTMCSLRGISVKDYGSDVIYNDHEPDKSFRISATRRDLPTKNGLIHEIDNIMDIPTQMAQYVVQWEPTDHIEFNVIPFYKSIKTSGSQGDKYYLKSGEIPGIRWETVPASRAKVWYTNEYKIDHDTWGAEQYMNNDALIWDLGDIGWLELDMPVLPKGHYDLKVIKLADPTNGGKGEVFINGVNGVANGNDINFSERGFNNQTVMGNWFNTNNRGQNQYIFNEESAGLFYYVQGSVAGWAGIDRLVFIPYIAS